jgi:periplasmic divalent cation tolerance protein
VTRDAVVVALMTAPSPEVAERIVRDLVERRLVACANILGGVRSIYRWRGAVEQAEEVLVVLKARASEFDAVAGRVKALHPYDVPELIAFPVAFGLEPYLHWIVEETGREASSG